MRHLPMLPLSFCALLLGSGAASAQQRIVEWSSTTNADITDNLIALGYAVPEPVDTPLPFDGFRSYAGLHMRHQDLVASTAFAHPHAIGQTLAGRTIWAYRLGDEDRTTVYGLPEPAMLTNGGIHAREWQSPEVVTGIMERLIERADDEGFHRYLLDNVNITLIPVMNVDGFQQTQRYPRESWLGTDPDVPEYTPRDGRMRRKNMRDVDEVLSSRGDHLFGIDLNRNHAPSWASSGSSSGDRRSLVYHGTGPHSEPESQALTVAAELGPASELRLYTDVHSFGRVLLWARTTDARQTRINEGLLGAFALHQSEVAGGRRYAFPPSIQVPPNAGIGSTDDHFARLYRVPAWTLEIEPPANPNLHPNEPLCGASYGGVTESCHDGFVLPESEIRRVRESLSETMFGMYYRQAGPPALIRTRVFDQATGALVFDAAWDVVSNTERQLNTQQAQPLQLGRGYLLAHTFDKPMRWRVDGQHARYPGVSAAAVQAEDEISVGDTTLAMNTANRQWPQDRAPVPEGWSRYRDDTSLVEIEIVDVTANAAAIAGTSEAVLRHDDADLTGTRLDADPATVARWLSGSWSNWESRPGVQGDIGGADTSIRVQVSDQDLGAPFVIEPGSSGAWFDPSRSGEGFVLEVLSSGQALAYFFTYDANGEQDWYTMLGEIRANRVIFPQVLRTSGGVFGPGFDPAQVTNSVVGSAEFAFASCDSGWMEWTIDGVQGRMQLSRLSTVLGLPCGEATDASDPRVSSTGSWFDPTHAGEGYVLERLDTGLALVFWFSFDGEGRRRWFYGTGEQTGDALLFPDLLTTRGPRFGAAYDSADLELLPWGSLRLELGCDQGLASWESAIPEFGTGQLSLNRLTRLDGLSCVD